MKIQKHVIYKFFLKLILLIAILIYTGLPILNPVFVLSTFVLLVIILTGQIRKINFRSIVLSVLSLFIFLCTFSFSFSNIQEGHNYLAFVKEDNLELKKALPKELYQISKTIFNQRYPKELQCMAMCMVAGNISAILKDLMLFLQMALAKIQNGLE